MIINVYICPKCGSYYGTNNMGYLEKIPNIAPPEAKDAGKIRSYRNKCSTEGCNGVRVKRQAEVLDLNKMVTQAVKRAVPNEKRRFGNDR